MRWSVVVVVILGLTATAARAEDSDAERLARWQALEQAIFGDRHVEDGDGVVALDAPPRALDAAVVPIGISLAATAPDIGRVTALYLIIDGNPSPLAATFHFGPAADTRSLRTRVRIDSYTLIHAVAETENGRLFVTQRLVKASGGCSAPSVKDPQAAMARLGQMKLKAARGSTSVMDHELQLLISHPNYNGMQMDQLTRNYTPARFIQEVHVKAGGVAVFDLDADISLSEDPAITFSILGPSAAPIAVEVHDSENAVFRQEFDLPRRPAS